MVNNTIVFCYIFAVNVVK